VAQFTHIVPGDGHRPPDDNDGHAQLKIDKKRDQGLVADAAEI